jgi:two-component system, LytTR family, sensor kinase
MVKKMVAVALLKKLPGADCLRWIFLTVFFWTGIGLVFALPHLANMATRRDNLLSSLAAWWSWGLLAPIIVAVDKGLPFSGRRLTRWLLPQLIFGPLLTVGYVYLNAIVQAALGVAKWSRLSDGRLLIDALQGRFLWSLLVYCLIVGVWEAYRYQRRYLSAELRMERLERNFSEARLNALRMQLDPHFLFNALNTISAQVVRNPRLARKMIEHLGDLLRLSLDSKNRQEIPLTQELAFLDHYLAIQKIRFGNTLGVEIRVAPEVKYALVPSLFMQPLVENAIRHGISPRSRGGNIMVTAQAADGRLEVRVIDDGVGLPQEWSLQSPGGVGLSVTRERISGMHPDLPSHLALHRRTEGGTEVEISLPLRFTEEDRDGAIV